MIQTVKYNPKPLPGSRVIVGNLDLVLKLLKHVQEWYDNQPDRWVRMTWGTYNQDSYLAEVKGTTALGPNDFSQLQGEDEELRQIACMCLGSAVLFFERRILQELKSVNYTRAIQTMGEDPDPEKVYRVRLNDLAEDVTYTILDVVNYKTNYPPYEGAPELVPNKTKYIHYYSTLPQLNDEGIGSFEEIKAIVAAAIKTIEPLVEPFIIDGAGKTE